MISKTNNWDLLKSKLTAGFIYCNDDLLSLLVERGYNSLFQKKILFGPLQYANHSCTSNIGIVFNEVEFRLRWENDDDAPEDKKDVIVPIGFGFPVLVKNANKKDLWFTCECDDCV